MEIKKCNCCGKVIKEEQGIFKEDTLEIVKVWGYFSEKDMQQHKMIICECCYDNWISDFRIPPQVEERTEVL